MEKKLKAKHKVLEVGWVGLWMYVSNYAGCNESIDVLVAIPLQGCWKILLAYFYLPTVFYFPFNRVSFFGFGP